MVRIIKVNRNLRRRARFLFGFSFLEFYLLLIFLYAGNLIFPLIWKGAVAVLAPWISTVLAAVCLKFIKAHKPDNFLESEIAFLRSKKVLSAGAPDREYVPYIKG